MKKIWFLLIILLFPFIANAANRISCDYKTSNGTVTISVSEDFKLSAVGKDSAAGNTYGIENTFSYSAYSNQASGVLDCSSVKELYMVSTGTNKYNICFTQNACSKLSSSGTTKISLIGNSVSSTTATSSDQNTGTEAQNNNQSATTTPATQNNNQNATTTPATPIANDDACNSASGLGPSLIFIGHIVRLAKILIPLVIIVMGIIDFFKAVTSGKDDEIKKVTKSFAWRLGSGVIIFFLPSVISLIFSWIPEWSGYDGSYQQCFKCVWDVGSCIETKTTEQKTTEQKVTGQ